MSKFLTQIQLKAGITTTFESATAAEVLDTLVELTSPAPGRPAAAPAVAAQEEVREISRGNMTLVVDDDPYAGKSPAPSGAPVVTEVIPPKKRADQKKGATKVAAVLVEAPAEVVVAPIPTTSAGKSNTYETVVATVRNFARTKGIPEATKLVAQFKTAKGDVCARLDQVQADDYAALLARIEALSV